MTPKRIWFFFVMTLLAGMMTGAAIMQVYIQSRLKIHMRGEQERYHEYFLRRLRTTLTLDDAQYEQIKTIVLEDNDKLQRIRQITQPEVLELAAQFNGAILQKLSPEQAVLYKDFIIRFPPPGVRVLNSAATGTPPKSNGQK